MTLRAGVPLACCFRVTTYYALHQQLQRGSLRHELLSKCYRMFTSKRRAGQFAEAIKGPVHTYNIMQINLGCTFMTNSMSFGDRGHKAGKYIMYASRKEGIHAASMTQRRRQPDGCSN